MEDDESLFLPEFDADGNQTRVQTSTGSWAVSYNNENRPTDFTAKDVTTWDPTQPVATRPLAIPKDASWRTAPGLRIRLDTLVVFGRRNG